MTEFHACIAQAGSYFSCANFNIIDILKWSGNFLIVYGLWKIGDKWRHAFLFSIAGETAWTIAALQAQDYALASICTVFNVMAFINWRKWGKDAS